MGLKDIESTLPRGFRFYPSDEELVFHYLYRKVTNERLSDGTLVEVDLHTSEPWELPEEANLGSGEWYFFSYRDHKYSTGSRVNRRTRSGYWKSTGRDRTVCKPSTLQAIIGMRKTLVFYRGRAPHGNKTGWVMHEFRLENLHLPPKEDRVLCRVFHKMKEETVRHAPENVQDDVGSSSLSVESSFPHLQVDQVMADKYEVQPAPYAPHPHAQHTHWDGTTSQNGVLNLAVWPHAFLDFPQPQGTESPPPSVTGNSHEE